MSLAAFLESHPEVIAARLTRVRGSSPREAGTQMFVSATGFFGTVGGGQLEYMAIDKARAMLRTGADAADMDVPLGPEIGQCCGGRVELALRRMTKATRAAALSADTEHRAGLPHVYVLGAGHVGRALAAFLQHLPVRCVLIDSRAAELDLCAAEVEKRLSVIAEADIRSAPPGSAFIVLTHDHALDFLLTAEALDRHDAAYVGLIGSATKRMKFERFCKGQAPLARTADLTCPIGAAGSADKRPEVIAAFVVAEVMAKLTETAHQPKETAR
jgi:xanthine dehydrogenase accessory factor